VVVGSQHDAYACVQEVYRDSGPCRAGDVAQSFRSRHGPRGFPPRPGVCYPALRCLPASDSHPLDRRSMQRPSLPCAEAIGLLLRDAPCRDFRFGGPCAGRGAGPEHQIFGEEFGPALRLRPHQDSTPPTFAVSSWGPCRTARICSRLHLPPM